MALTLVGSEEATSWAACAARSFAFCVHTEGATGTAADAGFEPDSSPAASVVGGGAGGTSCFLPPLPTFAPGSFSERNSSSDTVPTFDIFSWWWSSCSRRDHRSIS